MVYEIETIEDLGYDDFFEESRHALGLSDYDVARVTSENRGSYRVKAANGEYNATITGKKSFHATDRKDFPAVGDWVVLDKTQGDQAVIIEILARKTILERKYSGKDETQIMATNVDVALIVESADRDYSLNRFERYCALVRGGGIEPVVVLNKIDLLPDKEKDDVMTQVAERFPHMGIIFCSTVTGEGMDAIQKLITKSKTGCFLGSSGVGKSSLINKLLGSEHIKVGEIGEHAKRGQHTTTQREMHFLDNGGIVIDNPGIREVGLTDLSVGIDDQFDAIATVAEACKFADCTHMHEPGCAVLMQVESGEVDEGEYKNYISLKKESKHYSKTKREKRNSDKKFGKFIKTTKKELKKYGHKDYNNQ